MTVSGSLPSPLSLNFPTPQSDANPLPTPCTPPPHCFLLGLRALGKEVEMAEASFGEEGGLGEMGTEVCAPHS